MSLSVLYSFGFSSTRSVSQELLRIRPVFLIRTIYLFQENRTCFIQTGCQ